MGKLRKVVLLVLCFVLFGNATAFAGWMYSLDGRQIHVSDEEEAAYNAVGWYYQPVTVMYAPDGRTCVVEKSKVWDMKAVGWYDTNSYTMYSADGRTICVGPWEIEAYENVGWFRYEKDAKQKLYSAAGNEITVWKSEVESYLAVGWYYSPVVYLYSTDGRSILVAKSEADSYKKVGWYEKKDLENMQKNKNYLSQFYVGQQVVHSSLFGTKYGTVRALDYGTGKVLVYWNSMRDNKGNMLNDYFNQLLYGIYTEQWEEARYLSPRY